MTESLQQAQTQLLQSEKMASIGQLAAGIAHEINNPVGFINSNLQSFDGYWKNLDRIFGNIKKLRGINVKEEKDRDEVNRIVEGIKSVADEINLDFIVSDAGSLIRESLEGTERIRKIVLDLRTFARKNNDTLELVKIETVIDGVLSIMHSEMKYKTELKKNYGDVPDILCNPQRLGQVFINLFVNAVQSIPEKGIVEVKTYLQDGQVCIDVRDTGCGIEEKNLAKIFDAFFTTKPVGSGTGLGLSVSYDIVKKHGGDIKVQSKVGEGTTFTVLLPVKQQ
jgi:signal transduction histidine kinase